MKKMNQAVSSNKQEATSSSEYGGTILGFIVGLAVGLGTAFAIAFYLSKTTPQERPGIRAPSIPFAIKSAPAPDKGEVVVPLEPVDLNKALQGKSSVPPAIATPDPIAELANGNRPAELKPKAAPASSDAKSDTVYFLQVGAYAKQDDADAQKANLAIQGIQSKISEVSSGVSAVWRVRIGPFNSIDESTVVRDKLNGMDIKSTVIKSSKS
jgi:cell division protein FtsN|uniref:SPOR domain-containing protein n=1 Tax=Polynucleobacter sp. TaxID=2029855 RepID=UPI00404825D1